MLNGIKSMILEKESYMEAAAIIFEDAAHGGIDDLIVLNEKADIPEDDEDNKDPELGKDEDPDINDDKNDEGSGEDDDITNIPIDDENDIKDGDNPDNIVDPKPEEDDILGMSVDGDEIEPALEPTDDLPAVGNGSDDLLNISIDLRSNTIADVLPVPPNNAGEAIADDVLSTRIDSGFQEDAPATPAPVQSTDPAGAAAGFPMEEKDGQINESSSSFLEAITLDGGAEEKPTDGTEPTASPVDGSTPEDPGDPPAEEGTEGEENEVTAAVKDKVAEADTPIEGGDSTSTSKEALLKKLGSISKGLEDAKKAIIDTIK